MTERTCYVFVLFISLSAGSNKFVVLKIVETFFANFNICHNILLCNGLRTADYWKWDGAQLERG